MKRWILLFTMALLLQGSVYAQNKKIYIAPDDHTDYIWAADEETYRLAFLEMIDYYLNLADTTANNPTEYQSRWACDGSFWFKVYEDNRSATQVNRLVSRIKDGHISLPYNELVTLCGGQPAEAVLRGMYDAGRIERRYGLDLSLAVSMENQTMPYGLGMLWAGAGAKYSWKGVCNCASQLNDLNERDKEIYWWTGPDGSRILMKWNSNIGMNESIGGYAEARDPYTIVDLVDTNAQFKSIYPYSIIGAFGKGWDDTKTLTDDFVKAAMNKSTANRQVIVSDEEDFFEDFEATYGAALPSQSLAFGNEWDTYCYTMAEVTAGVRRAVEKLRAAEALASLVYMVKPDFMASREAEKRRAWVDLGLYWEHAWTGDGYIQRSVRAAWQRRIASEITGYVDKLHTDALRELGGLIQSQAGRTRFFVFNPLSWERTDYADLPYSNTAPFHVVDLSSGQEVPSQIVTVSGVRKLRMLAGQVPPVGYKVYEIRAGAGANFPQAASVTGATLENARYKVTLAGRGAITSLIDKTRGNREFVRTVNGLAMNDLGAGSGSVQVENAGPVSVTLLAVASQPLSHTSRVTLYKDIPRIDITNDINQNFTDVRTWGFGFALDSPDIWHEEVGAVIRAKLASQGGHYSPRNARYDWLTMGHFADISAGGVGLTLSNAECGFMKLGNSTPRTLDSVTPLIEVLIGGQVDGPTLGMINQGGDTHFKQCFSLMSHGAYSTVEAMKGALAHQNPLIAGPISGGSVYPEKKFSLLTVSNPNVMLWAVKPHEDGSARKLTLRLWNLAGQGVNPAVQFPSGTVEDAQLMTHLEVPTGQAGFSGGTLNTSLNAQQLKTYAVRLSPLALRTGVSEFRYE